MRDSVREPFRKLTVAFEGGDIGWMFPDVKGLVSTGFGLLLDPVSLALGLPWKRSDGTLATRDEVIADFERVKNHPNAARLGHKSVERIAQLRLSNADLDAAFMGKAAQMESVLRKGFPDWDDWCSDAQLGTMSMSWAVGPGFWSPTAGRNYWPKLTAALRSRDYRTAAVECFMNEEKKNPGIVPRNRANRVLFSNAACVAERGLDLEPIHWPAALDSQPIPAADPVDADDDRLVVPEDVRQSTRTLIVEDAIANHRKTLADES